MAQLSAAEIRKYNFRPEIFIKKLNENSEFEVKGGRKAVLIKPTGVDKVLRSGTNSELNSLRFADKRGNIYKLSDFVKTKEFGGKGEGSGTLKEDAALKSLKEQINAAKVKEGMAAIPVKIGTKIYMITDAISTPGTPKSDFHLVDINGKEVAWISHKDGSRAKDFQQWGGLSKTKEPKLYNHKETQAFVQEIHKLYPHGLPNATTVARKIEDNQLKMMSVYGNEYGKSFSRQNTTLMLQGDIALKKIGSNYNITATHTHLNGEKMIGDYEPVFMAIYKGDRSDFGIKGTRVVIAPYGCRKITTEI
jgi:hypothetical protein